MEMSHRSKEFIEIVEQAEKDFREMFNVPSNYTVFFLQGGASMQFTAIPFNLTKDNAKTNYMTTGTWSE